mgnify:CR=1 FL=1
MDMGNQMRLCNEDHVKDLLLDKYITACEKLNEDLAARTIDAVSGEICDMLSYRYPQPWPYVPELVRYIASVIAAYRVVEAITSLVDTEADSENEWLPLQKQWKYVTGLLEDIAKGKLKLPLDKIDPDREDPTFAVVSRKPFFDLTGF